MDYSSFIRRNVDKLDWHRVSKNPRATMRIILENPDLPWDVEGLSSNPNMTLDYIRSRPNFGGMSDVCRKTHASQSK